MNLLMLGWFFPYVLYTLLWQIIPEWSVKKIVLDLPNGLQRPTENTISISSDIDEVLVSINIINRSKTTYLLLPLPSALAVSNQMRCTGIGILLFVAAFWHNLESCLVRCTTQFLCRHWTHWLPLGNLTARVIPSSKGKSHRTGLLRAETPQMISLFTCQLFQVVYILI